MTVAGSERSASLVGQLEVVLDASVWVSRALSTDLSHLAASAWVNGHLQAGGYFTKPVWLLAEVGAAISRQIGPQDASTALALLSRLRRSGVMRFLPLGAALMQIL